MNKLSLLFILLFIASCSDLDKASNSLSSPLSTDVCEITIEDFNTPEALVLNRREIDYLMRGDIIDAPISLATKNDGAKVWFLPTALQQNGDIYLSHTIVTGDLDNVEDAEIVVADEEDFFVNSKALKKSYYGRHWVTNIVQLPEGLIAILHSEYTRESDFFGMECAEIGRLKQCAPGRSQIGLAWLPINKFENNEFSFEFLGNIAGSYSDVPHFNVHGTPWYFSNDNNGQKFLNLIFADGHFIQKKEEWRGVDGGLIIGQLRVNLKDLMIDISKGKSGSWTKFTEEGWVPPEAAVAKRILPLVPEMEEIDSRIAKGGVIVHSDAVYHEPTGANFLSAYVLKGRRGQEEYPSSIVFYKACPGKGWEYVGYYHPRQDAVQGWTYSTIVSSDDTDFGKSAGSFDIISGWDYGKLSRKVYRMGVEVSDGCSCD